MPASQTPEAANPPLFGDLFRGSAVPLSATTGLYGASIVYNYIGVIQFPSPTEGRLT